MTTTFSQKSPKPTPCRGKLSDDPPNRKVRPWLLVTVLAAGSRITAVGTGFPDTAFAAAGRALRRQQHLVCGCRGVNLGRRRSTAIVGSGIAPSVLSIA